VMQDRNIFFAIHVADLSILEDPSPSSG